jgi:hypothetical protein
MSKKCFLSFYYKEDNWRVQQIRNIGSIEEQPLLDANKWEEIQKKGDKAVEEWIETNLKGKDCLVVLVGANTSGRKWVKYEIKRACEKGIGVMGIYIHNLKDKDGKQSTKGSNPFSSVTVDGKLIASYAKMYDPPYSVSTDVYDHISTNIESWISTAIALRK